MARRSFAGVDWSGVYGGVHTGGVSGKTTFVRQNATGTNPIAYGGPSCGFGPGCYTSITAINRTGARLAGIRPQQTGAIAFLLASLLGGISGLLIGPIATLYYDSGFLIGLKAFVGAIIGGLASYPLTAFGALLVGLLESYASFWNSPLKEAIVFGALIPILLWRSLSAGGHDEEEEEDIT